MRTMMSTFLPSFVLAKCCASCISWCLPKDLQDSHQSELSAATMAAGMQGHQKTCKSVSKPEDNCALA